MSTFALAHPTSPKDVTAWCQKLTSYDKEVKARGLIAFECLNGGWHGRFDPVKHELYVQTDDSFSHPARAIKVWEGDVPKGMRYNEAVEWIKEQIK